MATAAEQDLDLVTITLRDLGPYKWTDAISSIQRFVFLGNIYTKYKSGFTSGSALQWNVQVNPSGAAAMVGIGATDSVNTIDTMTTANAPWRKANTNYGMPAELIAMNRESARIVDIVKTQRGAAMISLAELLETQGWSMPTGTGDVLNSFGIPYWVVPNTSQGFNGGNPFGFPAGAGSISSTAFPNWANYTDQYSDFSKLDLVRKMRRAAYFTDFEAPVNADIPTYRTGARPGYYMTYVVFQRLQEANEQQNDNLGDDVASRDERGRTLFRRNPIQWAPKLDVLSGVGMSGTFVNSTYTSSGGMPVNPVYGLQWDTIQPVFLKGWWMREVGPYPLNGIAHTVFVVQVDVIFNIVCRDRRRQFVLTQ